MPPALLASQLETLETLETDEDGMPVICEGGIETLTDKILENLQQTHTAVPAGTD